VGILGVSAAAVCEHLRTRSLRVSSAATLPAVRDDLSGDRVFSGEDVLQGMIDGIEAFVEERRHAYRVGAPVMLGCSPWVGDDKLLGLIEKLPGACIVITKPPRTPAGKAKVEQLRELNARTSGIELRALRDLAEMAPKVGGEPRVIGPYDSIQDEDERLSTFRAYGWRQTGRQRPPIVHAKLALLGNICWTDEHPSGHVIESVWFQPKRLWVASANFTYGSRSNVEFGHWTEDADVVREAERFLVSLIGGSEDIDSAADAPDPELMPVEYDDQAIAEAAAEWYSDREAFDDEDW
jgi:hypothetical protein